MYTELEALNHLLSQVGAAPVSTVNNPLPDLASAQLRLHEASVWVQKRGWWFNRIFNQTYEPDETTHEIELPSNTLKVVQPAFLIEKNDKLYDPYADSFEFDQAITLDLILLMAWEDMPGSAQDAILHRAAHAMVLHELEDHNKADRIEVDVQLAYIELKKDDLEIHKRNSFQLPQVQQFRYRVRPYKRYGSGSYNPNYPGGGAR